MVYQVAAGHNNAAGLTNLSPQPTSDSGVRFAEIRPAVSGSWYSEGGQFCILRYSVLTGSEYSSLITQFGLDSVLYAEVTVRLLSDENRSTFSNFNAIVKKPFHTDDGSWETSFWRNVLFRLNRLTAI